MAVSVTGRRRPDRLSRDLQRTQVLRVAQELFTAQGYHHASMDDIADQAHVSKPVLYRHFPSKLDLYLSVIDARGADLVSRVDSALAQASEPRDAITGVVLAYLRFADRAGGAETLLFESDVRHDPAVRARVERATALVTARVEQVLTERIGLRSEPAALLASCLTAMAQHAATERQRGPHTTDDQQTAALVARLAWDGLRGFLPVVASTQGERNATELAADLG